MGDGNMLNLSRGVCYTAVRDHRTQKMVHLLLAHFMYINYILKT